MKDPTTMWAAQAAEEQRRLAQADRPSPEQRAEWANDQSELAAGRDRSTGLFSKMARRIRRVLGR